MSVPSLASVVMLMEVAKVVCLPSATIQELMGFAISVPSQTAIDAITPVWGLVLSVRRDIQ